MLRHVGHSTSIVLVGIVLVLFCQFPPRSILQAEYRFWILILLLSSSGELPRPLVYRLALATYPQTDTPRISNGGETAV